MTIDVGVLAGNAALRAELRQMVAALPRATVTGAAASLDALRGANAPQVVLVASEADLDLTAFEAALAAGIGVVLLGDGRDVGALERLLRAGAACLPPAATEQEIAAAIEATAAGLTAMKPEQLADLLDAHADDAAPADEFIEPLTPRELEVLRLLADGLGNRSIAARLSISEHTAKAHVGHVLAKLSANTRAKAVAIGLRAGIIAG